MTVRKKSLVPKINDNKTRASLAPEEKLGVDAEVPASLKVRRLSPKVYGRRAARKRNRPWFAFWFY